MIYQLESVDGQMILQQQQHPSRYIVSLPPSDDMQKTLILKKENEELTEKESRRQSVYDDIPPPNSFCHLSREELIERVVQLEKEKQLTSNKLLLGTKSFYTLTYIQRLITKLRVHRFEINYCHL